MIRWGLLGAGDVAERRVAGALAEAEGGRLEAACRRDADKLRAFAERHGVPRTYSDVRQLCADPDIDALYIATPVALHKEHAIMAASSGKHVLCEKPMAMSVAECVEMAEACRKYGVRLGVAYYRRYYPKMIKIKELIEAGAIGRIVFATAMFTGNSNHEASDRSWLVDPALSGGGPLMDIGSHALDLLGYCLGKPEAVAALTGNVVRQYAVEDTASVMVRYAGGAQATLHVSFSAGGGNQLELFGERGRIRMDSIESPSFELIRDGAGSEMFELPKCDNMNIPLVRQFNRAVLTGEALLSGGEEAAIVSGVIEAAYASAKSGMLVSAII